MPLADKPVRSQTWFSVVSVCNASPNRTASLIQLRRQLLTKDIFKNKTVHPGAVLSVVDSAGNRCAKSGQVPSGGLQQVLLRKYGKY